MSERTVILPIQVSDSTTADRRWLLVDFGDAPIVGWCIHLALLRERLIPSLRLCAEDAAPSLEVVLDEGVHRNERARGAWQRELVRLSLSETELRVWERFFLEYFRDGVASVDHIDLDVLPKKGGRMAHGFSVTLKVGKSRPPLSATEARRRLGLTRR